MVLISVILPVFNGADTISAQLEALATQSYTGEWELIVADNGSTDGTRQVCTEWMERIPQLHIIASRLRAMVRMASEGKT